MVEWTNKAEIRPEEQSEKAESCRENLEEEEEEFEKHVDKEAL